MHAWRTDWIQHVFESRMLIVHVHVANDTMAMSVIGQQSPDIALVRRAQNCTVDWRYMYLLLH